MRAACVFLFILLVGTIGSAQNMRPLRPGGQGSSSGKSVNSVVDRLSGLAPEYKADLGFAILDASPKSLSPSRRRSVIEDVFNSAVGARHPYMLTEAAGHDHADTLLHVTRNMLGRSKTDTLDIQTRAIERALPFMPLVAVRLFDELRFSEVRASCKDAEVEDVSAFYRIATRIIEDARFKSISGQDKSAYVLSLVSNTRIPAQIAPLARMIADIHLPSAQLNSIADAFVVSLNGIAASDREMTAAEEGSDLTAAVGSLNTRLANSGIPTLRLVTAYREFLVRGLTAEACADHTLDRAEMASRFNALVPEGPKESNVLFLSGHTLTPEKTGATAPFELVPFDRQIMSKVHRIQTAHGARVVEEYRTGNAGTIEPDPSDVEDVVRYATTPEPKDSKCPVCDFYARAHLLFMLVDILPPGHELERAIDAEVDYLSFNSTETDDPVAWLMTFKSLLNISRNAGDEAKRILANETKKGPEMVPWGMPSVEADLIRNSLRTSSDPVIVAYTLADDALQMPYLTPDQLVQVK